MLDVKLGMIGITLAAFSVLLFSYSPAAKFPFFFIVLIIFMCSLTIFFVLMNVIHKKWYIRVFIVNVVLIILIPVVEGRAFLVISICFLSILAFTQLAMLILLKGNK